MARYIAWLVSAGLVLGAALAFAPQDRMCTRASASSTPGTARDLAAELQALVESQIDTVGDDPIHNAVLLVEGPGFKWKGAAGLADGKSEAMTPDHKFKIASIAKTFTATVILQLMEKGRLELDGTLEEYLDASQVDLDSLHIHAGISYGRGITIEQLLGHTSGITDYMEDPRFIPDVLEQPDIQYSPEKILQKYFAYRTNEKAAFPPGGGWQYADPNYVLLAMIIEKVTGSTLQAQYKTRIFDRLGMKNSYLEFYEDPRGSNPFSHAFFQRVDINRCVNTSFDWGGGGIVSTCEELNTFFRALLRGELFEEASTLALMLAAADRGYGGEEYDYGLGIMKRIICGLTFYGHGGAYDCDAFYCPEKDISVCMSLNQMITHGKRDKFVEQAVEMVLGSGRSY
ncbi:MAG: serine hydrolase [Candidatus Latescibacteria bacterium]|nr:serine hydrolase [Candidatus Latescibacterota bacterium]NIO57299.1 serine hydrolase [Candidatus Latescibacterota bacterium]